MQGCVRAPLVIVAREEKAARNEVSSSAKSFPPLARATLPESLQSSSKSVHVPTQFIFPTELPSTWEMVDALIAIQGLVLVWLECLTPYHIEACAETE